MFYTIYNVINTLNGKIYIGKHQTRNLDDGYMGSGKHLKRAIEKNGIDNFEKEILFVFETEEEMNAKEAELVTEEFVQEDTNYNLCPGGKGGFGYLNKKYWIEEKRREHNKKYSGLKNLDRSKYNYKEYSLLGTRKRSDMINENKLDPRTFLGKSHTEETKKKIGMTNSLKQSKNKNSQFGTTWITNGKENKKIKKEEIIPEGWVKGRVLTKTFG